MIVAENFKYLEVFSELGRQRSITRIDKRRRKREGGLDLGRFKGACRNESKTRAGKKRAERN